MLFKDTTKLVTYAELNSTVNFISLKPTIRFVESIHIAPILGNTLYNSLNAAYTAAVNEAAMTSAEQNLLEKCRCIIAPMLCYYYAPKSEVKLSDGGLQRMETATNKSAYQYQGTNYREAMLREGEACTEDLLKFLEENKTIYTGWTNSAAFTEYRKLFIKTGAEFDALFSSSSPYRNYFAMRSKMMDVEEHSIRMAIGDGLFDYLKSVDISSTLSFTVAEKKLMEKLKKAIANFTVAFSIPLLSIRIDANGITVVNLGPRASRDADAMRTNAGNNEFSNLIASCNDAGAAWLKDSIKFLTDNASDFPSWSGNTTIAVDTTAVNAELKGSFGMF